MIEATRLYKHFGAVTAVRDVSLRAADGRITGLVGPNGAGKSTTLRMLYTVLRPDAGDALIDGHSVLQRPLEAARRLGVLAHGAGIYPNLSARENILYFGALHGLARAAARARAAELIGLLNDDSSPVSKVHLGVVFLVDGDSPNISIRETDKLAGELLTLEEMRIYYLGMESWSQMVYDRLAGGAS